ncbi:Pol polyprotein [Plakobranchus ocellatus]|uniref:Pol polyprotein n=1 Tax=Plakobranchus ocellatus TaxID=259542 RepID=A0AAV4C7D2_9GAST|nr:Pol polyprotein [Plakobranchus ocellatus]
MGQTPKVAIRIAGEKVMAMVDTGSQVTTVSEDLVRRWHRSSVQPLPLSSFKLTAANGLYISMSGYLVADVKVNGQVVENAVVMVLKDQPGKGATCLLGMNVLQHIPGLGLPVCCANSRSPSVKVKSSKHLVRTTGPAVIIPASSVQIISVTCCNPAWTRNVLMEPAIHHPKPGLFILQTFANVERGKTAIPIVNATTEDLILNPRRVVGTATDTVIEQVVDLRVDSMISHQPSTSQAADDLGEKGYGIDPSVVDLSKLSINPNLSSNQRKELDALIFKFADVFQWTDSDLGYTDLIRHKIIVTDDMPVAQATGAYHQRTLKRELGVKLKPSKCQFLQEETSFLGHRISRQGIRTDPNKIAAVIEFPTPKTLRNVREFVGLASYYRRFVKDFAKKAKPLHRLISEVHQRYPQDTKKGERKELQDLWSPECQQAFWDLKVALTSDTVLGYADYSKEFILEVDVCKEGLGAVLSHKQDDWLGVIAYASRSVRPSENTDALSRNPVEPAPKSNNEYVAVTAMSATFSAPLKSSDIPPEIAVNACQAYSNETSQLPLPEVLDISGI